jgi:hypothetical protein
MARGVISIWEVYNGTITPSKVRHRTPNSANNYSIFAKITV